MSNRGCDGSANPYLALAVMLTAGMDGIDRDLDPGEPNRDNLFTLTKAEIAERGIVTKPPTLRHATAALLEDAVLREALGKGSGGDYIDCYAEVEQLEFMDYHRVVSPWEVERYLTLF